MSLSKKYTYILRAVLIVSAAVLFFAACKAAIGTPWYQRSAGPDDTNAFAVIGIAVKKVPVTAVLAAPPVDDADKLKKFSEAKSYIVVLPPDVKEISAEDITTTAVSDLTQKEPLTVEVTLNGDSVPLITGQAVPVTIKIADAAGDYAVQEKVITVTRNEPYPLTLESLAICGIPVTADSITVPYTVGSISAKDIAATFAYGGNKTVLPVDLGVPSVKLYENEAVEITLAVKGVEGQYQSFEKTVSVTREIRPANADAALEADAIYVLGYRYEAGKALGVSIDTQQITESDVVASFKDFGDIPVKMAPNPAVFGDGDTLTLTLSVDAKEGKYQAWETSLTVKKDPTAVYNPQDKNGNKKYIVKVKTITEEQSPFDYYKRDYEFPASKFDNWVLVMPSMSGIIASYKFQDGSWSGSPDSIDNIPSGIGSGIKAISNVKVYRYKTRAGRWSAHDGYVPAADSNDSRFYFYRFTADASGGVHPDSSLFCVDSYSKFWFYYSEPSNLEWMFGNAVPKDWVDYATATKKDHLQFAEPFYMTDPVGYVKEDGSVVIYSWLKENINNSQYHAQKNSAYTQPAAKSPGKPGYSPYRDNVSIKRNEVETTVNPAYTVAVPVILGQPKAVRVQLNAAEEAVFTVKTAPAPKGETLSYQWYKNTIQSNEGGEAIPGAASATYAPDKSVATDDYVYCMVTNTNENNGAAETVASRAVKRLIREGSLAVDAEQPIIIEEPKNTNVWINTTNEIKLTAKAASPDKGEITYQWYKNTTNSNVGGTPILNATEGSYTVDINRTAPTIEYYYCNITNTNTNKNIVDGNPVATISTKVATVEVEEGWPLIFSVKNNEGGNVIALRNQQRIGVNTHVKRGDKISFLAFPDPNYEAQPWEGPTVTANPNLAERTITCNEDAETNICTLAYIPPGKLTVTPTKLKNLTFNNHSQGADGYFVHDFRISNYYDILQSDDFVTIWEKYKGKKIPIWSNVAIWHDLDSSFQIAHYIKENKQVTNNKGFVVKYEYVKIDTELIHYHGKYKADTYYYPTTEQILSDYRQSAIEFKYDRGSESWKCNTNTTFNISNVTVSYPADFTLARGETKDFVIKYDYAGRGTAEVTYTLKWE